MKFNSPRLLLVLVLVIGAVACAAPDEQLLQRGLVELAGGVLVGSTDQGVGVYRGVPYAQAPVGSLRWAPPVASEPWKGTFEATDFSPACPQIKRPATSFYGPGADQTSEDCLYLNIWTTGVSDQPKPVMVWIHGGSLRNGHGGLETYNGVHFAKQGVVLVTINYRLGPFGFLAHPLLTAESEHRSSGTYGLLDQIESLRWVKENIAAFGGDPSRVTIFGESAGSLSVSYLQASPLAAGLFHRAIGESGSALRRVTRLNSDHGGESAETAGARFAKALLGHGEVTLEALRAAPVENVLAIAASPASAVPAGVSVDGWFLPDTPLSLFKSGRQNDVAVIAGWNADEGPSLIGDRGPMKAEAIRSAVSAQYPGREQEYLDLYPANDDALARAESLRAQGVAIFGWGARKWMDLMSTVSSPGYYYYFERVPPGPGGERYGSFHAAEISYVFGTLGAPGTSLAGVEIPHADHSLSEVMMRYWINFAANGDPNGEGLPPWPIYEAKTDASMVFGEGAEVRTGVRQAELDFFDSVFDRD